MDEDERRLIEGAAPPPRWRKPSASWLGVIALVLILIALVVIGIHEPPPAPTPAAAPSKQPAAPVKPR